MQIFSINLWRLSHRIVDYGGRSVKIKAKNAKLWLRLLPFDFTQGKFAALRRMTPEPRWVQGNKFHTKLVILSSAGGLGMPLRGVFFVDRRGIFL